MNPMVFLPAPISRSCFTFPSLTILKPQAASTRRNLLRVAFPRTITKASVERRSGNYKRTIWEQDFAKTLNNRYTGEMYVKRAESLKCTIKRLLESLQNDEKNHLALLVLIDNIQRLGLGYSFNREIQTALEALQSRNIRIQDSLHAISLYFRLLRQHGFSVSQDVFKGLQDQQGNIFEHLNQDVTGMLSLYEASYYSTQGEDILDEAKVFTRQHLDDIRQTTADQNLVELINHTLDLPLNLRVTRLEARWFIDAFSWRESENPQLLELAKIDYNIVQAAHQKDFIDMSRWWNNLDILKRFTFVRNRIVECFCWALESAYEPQDKFLREVLTKLGIVITVADDVHDIYATFKEARLLTDAIQRWDVNAIEHLPDLMKLTFLFIFNTTNEIAYQILKDHDLSIIPCSKKLWADQCRSYAREIKWFHAGYMPTFEEYLDNGWVSVGIPIILVHVYFSMCPLVTKETLEYLESYPDLIRFASTIIRLTNDMATSKAESERGDVAKSIQCIMHHEGVSEEEARKYIRHLIDETWKKVNAAYLQDSTLPAEFKKVVMDCARFSETVYQYGEDKYGFPDKGSKDLMLSLLADNIPIL